ncbi:piggyBac transposable element-derived protein 3-like [Parasteatoda tepidariorum]|uniref:piggyBac transposable element-derived protein 3-like n=1 Tax=Parasteatoda tepidariorum TaxID=114398 RepID=UPI001C723165|nr:piggyBac transposable element-derived protein 3-like [Parasteatoda tepidariorum]
MSRKRYFDIRKYLHFNSKTAIYSSFRDYKVRPIYELFNEAIQQFRVSWEHLNFDERAALYFGKHGCKMYRKGKPVKFTYKLWMPTSFDGYSFHIMTYQGAKQDIESGIKKEKMSLSQMVVENLLSIGETPAKHKIYMDNFFSSYDLFATLKCKTFDTETVRKNRMGKNSLQRYLKCWER